MKSVVRNYLSPWGLVLMRHYYPVSAASMDPLRDLCDDLSPFTASLVIRGIRKLAAMGLDDREVRAYLVAMYPLLDANKLMKLYRVLKQME